MIKDGKIYRIKGGRRRDGETIATAERKEIEEKARELGQCKRDFESRKEEIRKE